jgi:hypothetical protein
LFEILTNPIIFSRPFYPDPVIYDLQARNFVDRLPPFSTSQRLLFSRAPTVTFREGQQAIDLAVEALGL